MSFSREIFGRIAEAIAKNPSMEEDEVTLSFDKASFFDSLGYKQFGVDIRSQKTLKETGKRPDRFCRDDLGNTIFVFETKAPTDDEFRRVQNPRKMKWFSQLWDEYVLPTRASYGILTNGSRFILFERIGENAVTKLDLPDISQITEEDSDAIATLLHKPQREFDTTDEVRQYIESDRYDSLPIDKALDEFYDTYSLDPESQFGKLLKGLVSLFATEYKEKAQNFTTVAFDFWAKSFAAKPRKIPESWMRFKECKDSNLLQFMFCLESAHIVLARLILAKVCEDYGFPGVSGIRGSKDQIQSYRDKISPVAYSLFFSTLLAQMRDALVESIFEEDIYSWWTDSIQNLKAKTNKEVAETPVSPALIDFSTALRQVMFSIARFNFSSSRQDILGNLYQTYFDRESRKALGEFYTKEEVVEYILNETGYEEDISDKRLMDPCCGSGTFVVGAVRRYLADADRRLPETKFKYGTILRDLCLKPRIVALDIHPFAVIMTQVRLMIELVPTYLHAIKEDSNFLIRRLPAFRTDSLQLEKSSQAGTLLSYGTNSVIISTELPIRQKAGTFHKIAIAIPDKEVMYAKGDVSDAAEYFSALQGLFDTVKELARRDVYQPDPALLKKNLASYLSRRDFDSLAGILETPSQEILKTIRSLKYDFGDGRLLKSLEDVVLASILKNYISYDFVVANPPYIRAFRGEGLAREEYRNQYSTPVGSFDTYAVFIERFVRLLNEDGRMGIITSNKYLVMDYAIHLRPFISNNCNIIQLIDLTGCPDAFDEPLIYACILIAKRRDGPIDVSETHQKIPDGQLLVALVKANQLSILNEVSHLYTRHAKAETKELEAYWVRQAELPQGSSGTWEVFLTPKIRKIVGKLYSGSVLMNDPSVGTIRGGIRGTEYAAAEKFVVEGKPSSSGKYVKLLNVGSIGHYAMHWGKPIRYHWKRYYQPYVLHDPKFFSTALWTTFESPKVLVRGVARELTSFYDKEGVGFLRAIWGILPDDGVDPQFLTGLLNSKLYDFLHKVRMRSARIPEGSYSYSQSFIESLPIRLPKTAADKGTARTIARHASRLAEVQELELKVSLFPESYIPPGAETKVEAFTPNSDFAGRDVSISRNLSGYLVINAGSTVLHSTSRLSNQENNLYLTRALRNLTFRKNEEVRIRFPHGQRLLLQMLDDLDKDENKLRTEQAKGYQDKLDEAVYDYYRVDRSDLDVIESVLKEMDIGPSTADENQTE